MDNLLKQLPEIYQPVTYRGVTYEGKRDCKLRYDAIRQTIQPHDVIIDVGSSLGYFAINLAKRFPDSLVVSFESEEKMCEVQKKICKGEGLYNIIICQHRLSKDDIVRWSKHVDLFDTVLMLSVLHHYPSEAVSDVLTAFLSMTRQIVLEVPEKTEKDACGQDSVKEIHRLFEDMIFNTLHEEKSHLSSTRYTHLLIGDLPRENLDAFFGVSHEDRHRFKVNKGMINDKPIIKGLNVWNLLHHNIVWPEPHWWVKQAVCAYECLHWKSDIRPWNLLVTSSGVRAIDFTTVFKQGDQAEDNPEDMEKIKQVFGSMKAIW